MTPTPSIAREKPEGTKRKRNASPTQMTLKELRDRGYMAQVVEQTIRGPGIIFKRDFMGCIDIIALRPAITKGIQACIGADHARRRAKAVAEPRLQRWLAAGNLFAVWSWRMKGKHGKRKLWELREESITLSDLPAAVAEQRGAGEA